MSKPNTMVLLIQARKEIQRLMAEMDMMKSFTIQQCMDVAEIALNDEFQFGPVYNKRFEKAFKSAFMEFANMCIDDDKDDHELVYTKAKFDRALIRARGEDTPEFDVRYQPDYFYRRGEGFGEQEETNGK